MKGSRKKSGGARKGALVTESYGYRDGESHVIKVATYNVHRWIGLSTRKYRPERAAEVISELEVDIIALQEVLRPFDRQDPLTDLASALGLHVAFVSTRLHRHGWLGNAILSRRPIDSVFTLDLSFNKLEHRAALAARIPNGSPDATLGIVSTHLALLDRTRKRQVQKLLDHPDLQGPTILLGDMNAWRKCRATRQLNLEFGPVYDQRAWPLSFPSARPMLALDRIYVRGALIRSLSAHDSTAARIASDHLPVVAVVEVFPHAIR